MALFGRQQHGPTVGGRAAVVPESTANLGDGSEDSSGSFNNFTSGSRVRSNTVLVARSADDGGPVDADRIRVRCTLPNWMRMVMYDAGSGRGQSRHLPDELDVPVLIDQATRKIVALDEGGAQAELERFRELGIREWKDTEAILAPVRGIIKLPGTLRREVPATLKDWSGAFSDLAGDFKEGRAAKDAPLTDAELSQHRQGAEQLRRQFVDNPARREAVRKNVLKSGPALAAKVAAGKQRADRFGAWVDCNVISGVLEPDEARELRRAAGLPLDDTPPPAV